MYKKQKLILAPGLQDRITQSDFFLKSSLTENVKESIFEPVIYSGDRRNNFASSTRLGGIYEPEFSCERDTQNATSLECL